MMMMSGHSARGAVDLDRVAAGLLDQRVERAGVVVQEVERDDADQHGRDEERQEHRGLADLLEERRADLVEHDRDRDLQDVPQHDEREVVEDRVPRQQPELAGLEEELEVLEPDERAAEDPVAVVEVGEGDPDAGERGVVEDDEEHDRRDAHEQEHLAVRDLPSAGTSVPGADPFRDIFPLSAAPGASARGRPLRSQRSVSEQEDGLVAAMPATAIPNARQTPVDR